MDVVAVAQVCVMDIVHKSALNINAQVTALVIVTINVEVLVEALVQALV